jgi:maltose O-acetyltransferase
VLGAQVAALKGRVRVARRQARYARWQEAGITIGSASTFQDGVLLDEAWGWLISIGERCVFAPRVSVFAHDAGAKRAMGYTRVAPVTIGDRVYLGAGATVLPGVSIGDDAVIGAGSVISRDVAPATVVAGAPARVLGTVAELVDRRTCARERGLTFDDVDERRASPTWVSERVRLAAEIASRGEAWVL